MIGLVLVTHGKVGVELLLALEHVVGPQQQAMALAIGPNDDVEKCRQDLRAAVSTVDRGKGVIVCTDMFGGTPSNLAISLLGEKSNLEVIAGVNLPLLVRLASIRDKKPMTEVVHEAQEAGRKYISVASALLNGAVA